MDINILVKITSRAWSLKVLALMHDGVVGRQASLLAATKASRTAFSQSLAHLVDLRLLERNPGHGHPLRPEYKMTPMGAKIAKTASQIMNAASGSDELVLLRRAWAVPVLAVIQAPRYFTEIRTDLCSISDRALSKSLYQLEERRWLTRQIDTAQRSPRPIYQAANIGVEISKAVSLGG